MTLKPDVFRYFERIGASVPLKEFSGRPEARNLLTLRHDIDHSLDVALEMAFWQHRAGLRATYYLLDTASYWQDPRLSDKCLQLVDFGHEIGLHLNVLAKWYSGEIDDVEGDILRTLARFRSAGIEVTGVAAHGDQRCYEGGFINYWCFSELRPDDPVAAETGLSAEGVAPASARHSIAYPAEHTLTRADGRSFPLWSVRMADLGLDYDAMHVPMDRYFTDSGGGWTRSPDPLTQDLRRGRHQVLIHPIHWRELPHKTFFLSTARSASTWLSRVVEEASSAHGTHEFSLNHRFDGESLVAAKRTFGDLDTLLADGAEVGRLLREARDYMETLAEDWAEANVYLAHFLDALREVFPDAMLVHLHRDPRAVVNSLVNRGWYDTPGDPLHPPLSNADSSTATAFERVCHYVAETNGTLLKECPSRIACEQMTTNLDYLGEVMAGLGIAFYPRLAASLMGTRLNAGGSVGPPEWSAEQSAAFTAICGQVAARLGYRRAGSRPVPAVAKRPRRRERRRTVLRLGDALKAAPLSERMEAFVRTRLKKEEPAETVALARLAVMGCSLEALQPITLRLIPGRHGHLLFGGGTWGALGEGEGFDYVPGGWFAGTMELAFTDEMSPALYCLSHDAEGRQIDKKLLAVFGRHAMRKSFAFRPRASAPCFNLALYFSAAEAERRAAVTSLLFEEVS